MAIIAKKETLMGELATMGSQGDTKLIWDPANDDEVENARRTFTDLTKKGYLAFGVKARGEKGEQIRAFNPEIEKIIMVPPMVGG